MAPKKRKNLKNENNNKRKKSKVNGNQNDNNERIEDLKPSDDFLVIEEEINGLRRSKRISTTVLVPKYEKTRSSKYFCSDSEESEHSYGTDEEFKPQVKPEFKPEVKSVVKSEVKPKADIVKVSKKVKLESESDSSENEWEEVKDNDLDDYDPDIPKEGVQITINDPMVKGKKKERKCFDVNDMIRQNINRFKKELQINRHKTSLLMFIARIIHLNDSTNDETVRAIALSFTINQFKAPKKLTEKFLSEFIKWFNENFNFKTNNKKVNCVENTSDSICRCLQEKSSDNYCHFVLSFISLFRSVNQKYNIRICYALSPIDMKPMDLILTEKQLETKEKSKKSNKSAKDSNESKDKVKDKSKSKRRKVVSSDSDESPEIDSKHLEYWIEIYIESEKKWVSYDVINNIYNKHQEINMKCLKDISYIISIDSEGFIREVTQRYSIEWMSAAMKRRRIEQNWWTKTLRHFQRRTKNSAENAEDVEFEDKQSSMPLPTKVSEYKNHPLYVLTKDLLKFQGIYPSDAPPLGFIRGEPVYGRECVQLLRSRETWLRFARTVKIGETPYKMVKSRPKWDKYSKTWKRDLPLELFGEWQTEPYDPPEAKDGKVPRNGYGNIDLFQPCMLPKGCVHIKLPGLLRVANKLKIDCVPAIVAFDNNNGGLGSHPVMDGFIVCKEFEDILIDAWNEDQEIARKREMEKKDKRVYGNWKKLIRALIIREKVKHKYQNSQEERVGDNQSEDQSDSDN